MKKFFALVAVGLLILGAASCDTKNIGNLGGNSAPLITSATYVEATRTLTVTINEPNPADVVTVTCSVPAGLSVDSASKTFSKTGNVTFIWSATNPAVGGSGTTTITASDGIASDTETEVITVPAGGANTAPTVAAAYAGNTLTVTVTDAENDDVTVTVTEPAGLNADATSKTVVGGNGNTTFTWTGAPGATGTTTVTANDGALSATATAVITIPGGGNTAPTVTAAYAGNTLTVTVTDAENDDVTVTVTEPAGLAADATTKTVVGGNGNTTFTWTGAPGATGTTTITASDGALSATTTAGISIPAVVNTAPVITNSAYAEPTLTVTVSDAEGDDVTVTVTEPAGLTADATTKTVTGGNGSVTFTWTGAGGTTGNTTITASDGALSDTDTETISIAATNAAPEIGAVTYANGTLTVPVTDADGGNVDVTVTVPAGLAVDALTKTVAVPGDAVFAWSATDFFLGGTGDTTITADDGAGGTDTATQTITVAGLPVAPDTLYAYPTASTAAVGTPVTVLVYTGTPANPLQFLSSVGFTVETAGTYVANTFNVGNPGGARTDTDGYWALMGPPAPGNGLYLDLGDALMPGAATDIGGGVHRYNFAVVTQGPFAAPAALPGGGAILFNFQLTFSAAGTYNLGFQLNDGTFDQTYYSDQNGTNFFWGTLDASNSITVN